MLNIQHAEDVPNVGDVLRCKNSYGSYDSYMVVACEAQGASGSDVVWLIEVAGHHQRLFNSVAGWCYPYIWDEFER